MEKTEENKYYAKEMKRIAAKQTDQYNSAENLRFDPTLYNTIVHSDSRYAPQSHMKKLDEYVTYIKMLQSFSIEKSTKCHIETPRGSWYTHRSPLGCFMCEDQQFISVLVQMLEYLTKTYPNMPIRPL